MSEVEQNTPLYLINLDFFPHHTHMQTQACGVTDPKKSMPAKSKFAHLFKTTVVDHNRPTALIYMVGDTDTALPDVTGNCVPKHPLHILIYFLTDAHQSQFQ